VAAKNPNLAERCDMSINLEDYELLTIFVVSSIVILGASEIGRLLGRQAVGRGGGDVSTPEGAVLGLLH